MIDLSYRNAPNKVLRAINVTEPIARKSFEAIGYTIKDSTRDEDFNGIDLKVVNPKTNKTTIVDVKCSEDRNQNTSNFLFTVQSKYGKYYKEKQTEYVAFINFPKNEIVIIDINKLSPLIDNAKQRHGDGIYVLINKQKIRELGYSISIV